MKATNLLAAAALCAGLSSFASAQVTLRLVSDQDVALLCDSVNNPGFYIGNNPSVISLVGDSLFVAGFRNNNSTDDPVAATGQMVKIENIFGARAFRAVPSSQVTLPAFRGFYGLQYDYGSARGGLILNYDAGAVGAAGAFKLFDVDTQLNPILVNTSNGGTGPRGGAGPGWDYGADGMGFDVDSDPMTPKVPVMALLDFSNYGGVQSVGPFGVRTLDSAGGDDGLSAVTARVYDGNSVDGGNNSIAPIFNTPGTNGVTISGALWRDIAVDPRNGNMAARTDNDVVIATRNALNGTSHIVLDRGSVPFQIMQRVEILWGSSAGDLVMFNDYTAAGTSLSGWIKTVDQTGAPAAVSFVDANGASFDPANGGGTYDLSWDGINGRLAICDFANRRIYVFEVAQGSTCGPCYADYNADGGVDGADVEAFFVDWSASVGCADTNEDGGIDGSDVETFFIQWSAGGC